MKNQTGSVLITVMAVMSLLVFSLTMLWRSSLYARKSSTLRAHVMQQRYSLESFLRYGIKLLAHDYAGVCEVLSTTHESTLLVADAWPLSKESTWTLSLTGKRVDNGLELFVRAPKAYGFIGCRVSASTQGVQQQLCIDAWYEV